MIPKKPGKPQSAKLDAATELIRMAYQYGLAFTGADGLLKQHIKTVIQTALNEDMPEHSGHEKNDPAGRESWNIKRRTVGKLFRRIRWGYRY